MARLERVTIDFRAVSCLKFLCRFAEPDRLRLAEKAPARPCSFLKSYRLITMEHFAEGLWTGLSTRDYTLIVTSVRGGYQDEESSDWRVYRPQSVNARPPGRIYRAEAIRNRP